MAFAVRRTRLMEWFWGVHARLYRATGGLVGGKMQGMPVLLLTTRGRKSGEPRTVALMYLPRGDAAVVIASNAGEPKHPAWWLNLLAEPRAEIERGGARETVTAREAQGDERERIWKDLAGINSAYTTYQSRTERQIPVVVLEPARG